MSTHSDDRLHILLEQLDAIWELLDARLCERRPFGSHAGSAPPTLSDDEYFWEPAPNCWSLRRVDEPHAPGITAGEWVLEGEYPAPSPPPVTTIAWRICHVGYGLAGRYDYTFGTHSLLDAPPAWPGTATEGIAYLAGHIRAWRDGLASLGSADLDLIGRSQYPGGLDPHVRFVDLVGWVNVETAHHAAEIALLRDLYRARR